jgi:amino acid transporter
MVFMSYVEVFGAAHNHVGLATLAAPLTFLSKAYGVGYFKVPVALGAMVSFFSLTLSCLNAGSRIIFSMAHHSVFPKELGKVHEKNRTPYVAISSYIFLILAIPCVLEIFTNPLTTFGDGGTLAAFGFLTAYYLITIAAPVYLKKRGELKPRNVVVAVIACVALAVPTIGSFVPVPPFPVRIFPYIFLAWMLVGGSWLYALNRRKGHIFSEIEVDLDTSMQASVRSHDEDMGKVFDVHNGNRPVPPTFEELELALTGAA